MEQLQNLSLEGGAGMSCGRCERRAYSLKAMGCCLVLAYSIFILMPTLFPCRLQSSVPQYVQNMRNLMSMVILT